MGDVYKEPQTRSWGRGVAIKLLPAAFASDPERLSRFRREAQVLASAECISNIAHIYGLEESGDTRCYRDGVGRGGDAAGANQTRPCSRG